MGFVAYVIAAELLEKAKRHNRSISSGVGGVWMV